MFIGNTRIQLANGKTVRIDQLEEGQQVRGITGAVNTVLKVQERTLEGAPLFSIANSLIQTTWDRPFLGADGSWYSINPGASNDLGYEFKINKLDEGTRLLHLGTSRGLLTRNVVQRYPAEEELVYGLELDGDHTYIANKFVVHNPPSYFEDNWNNMSNYIPGGYTQAQHNIYGSPQAMQQSQIDNSLQQVQNVVAQTAGLQDMMNQTQHMLNQWQNGGIAGGGGVDADGNPIPNYTYYANSMNQPFMPNPTGAMGPTGGSLENAWRSGADEARQIYNLGQPQLDPNNYLDKVMSSMTDLMTPQANPYLDEMYNIGAGNIADTVMSSLGTSGRGMSFGPSGGNDALKNYIDKVGTFGAQFYGDAYNNDMNRALQAASQAGSVVPQILTMQADEQWRNLRNYSDIVSQLTGTAQQKQEGPDGPSTFDKLLGVGTMIGGFMSDRRLKENIDLVGYEKGLNVYDFNYLGSKTRYRGVMADEVLKVNPDAVKTLEDGFQMVDYDALGIEMKVLN